MQLRIIFKYFPHLLAEFEKEKEKSLWPVDLFMAPCVGHISKNVWCVLYAASKYDQHMLSDSTGEKIKLSLRESVWSDLPCTLLQMVYSSMREEHMEIYWNFKNVPRLSRANKEAQERADLPNQAV